MTKPRKKKVKKQYLAGTSGALRAKRKAALKRLNKNNIEYSIYTDDFDLDYIII